MQGNRFSGPAICAVLAIIVATGVLLPTTTSASVFLACLGATILYAVAMTGRYARELPPVTRSVALMAVTQQVTIYFVLLPPVSAMVLASTSVWLIFQIARVPLASDRHEIRGADAGSSQQHRAGFVRAVHESLVVTLDAERSLASADDPAKLALHRAARHADAMSAIAPPRERALWATLGSCIRECDFVTAIHVLGRLDLQGSALSLNWIRYQSELHQARA